MKYRRINLFGGPGSGKSTIAAEIYSFLKRNNISIELIQEYIKTWAYTNNSPQSFDQLYIFAKQIHKEDLILRNNVKLIVTDCPLLIQLAYADKPNLASINEELLSLNNKFEQSYPSINIFLKRDNLVYSNNGRWESEEQAKIVDQKILNILNYNNIEFSTFKTKHYQEIIKHVENKIR